MDTEQLLLIKIHKLHNILPRGNDTQGRVLRIVTNHDGINQKKLQEIIGIQPGSLSEILLKMEKAGYILRKDDENDKRRHQKKRKHERG